MILLHKLDKSSLLFASILVRLRLTIHISDPNRIAKSLDRNGRMIPIRFDKRCSGQTVRTFDSGDPEALYRYTDRRIPQSANRVLGRFFLDVTDIGNKVRLAFLSQLPYERTGSIIYYAQQNIGDSRETLFLIHTNLISFLAGDCGIRSNFKIRHIYYPFSDLMFVISKVFKFIKLFLCKPLVFRQSSKRSRDHAAKDNNAQLLATSTRSKLTAIVYHQSKQYGSLYKKDHYYSFNSESPLFPEHVIKYVNIANPTLHPGDSDLIPLRRHVKISFRNLIATIHFAIKIISSVRKLEQFYFAVFATIFYARYISYIDYFRSTHIANVIIDFDVHFSKPLSLALETCNINTIAIQERPADSFAHNYGVISSVYFYAGSLYMRYGELNGSGILCKQGVNFGCWRVSIFDDPDLVSIDKIIFKTGSRNPLNSYEHKIVVAGYFLTEIGSESPLLNEFATESFFTAVKNLSKSFPDCAVILRMKIVNTPEDSDRILGIFSSCSNLFLCDDYNHLTVSYRLCKEADVVVAVYTTLAEECLAYGKKVVMLDDYHSVSRLCTDIYPEEFHFTIAKDNPHMISLVYQCLHEEEELLVKYRDLNQKLSGDIDLSVPGAVSRTIEQYLCESRSR